MDLQTHLLNELRQARNVDRSVAISGTGKKERNKFFNTLDAKIVQAKERIAGLTWQTE